MTPNGNKSSSGRKSITIILAVAVGVFLVPPGVQASTTLDKTVTASGVSFSPQTVRGSAGTTVNWVKEDGTHTVRSATDMFMAGAAQWPYSRVFSAGTFGYYCEFHSGMSGRVRIKPRVSNAPDGLPFTVRWATGDTNTGSQFKVQYRVDGGSWKTWRSSTSGAAGVFGKGGAPTVVVAGRTYAFRVKSISGNSSSGYSPVRNVRL